MHFVLVEQTCSGQAKEKIGSSKPIILSGNRTEEPGLSVCVTENIDKMTCENFIDRLFQKHIKSSLLFGK